MESASFGQFNSTSGEEKRDKPHYWELELIF